MRSFAYGTCFASALLRMTRKERSTRHLSNRRMLAVDARCPLPGPGDLQHRRLVEIAAGELHRQRQAAGRQAGHHGEGGMAGDVERRARLARIGALEVGRPVDAAEPVEEKLSYSASS